MITNSVLVAAENAILTKLLTAVAGTICKSQIYISDEDVIKEPMPYIIVHAESYEEVIGPGIGIFKVPVRLIFRSHVKETSTNQRTDVVNAINNFAYATPAVTLSTVSGFHCHGFEPSTGSMVIDGEHKAYCYEVEFTLHCMPSDG